MRWLAALTTVFLATLSGCVDALQSEGATPASDSSFPIVSRTWNGSMQIEAGGDCGSNIGAGSGDYSVTTQPSHGHPANVTFILEWVAGTPESTRLCFDVFDTRGLARDHVEGPSPLTLQVVGPGLTTYRWNVDAAAPLVVAQPYRVTAMGPLRP